MLKDLMNKTFQKELAEGKHKATITNWTYNENTKNHNNDYIQLSLTIDGELNYKRNMFERDMSIFLSHTRKQLNKQNENINPTEYLNELVSNKTELDLWVAYPIVPTANGLRRVQNMYWAEPAAELDGNEDDSELPDKM